MSFSLSPSSNLPIESKTLTIEWPWPWNDFDPVYDLKLRHGTPSLTDVQVAKLAFSNMWPWPWLNDLDTETGPRYGQDVPPCQCQLIQKL